MMPPSEHSAVVVDDHPLVARGIADFLRTHCKFARTDAISRAADLWMHIGQFGAPTLALIDFWLPEGTALPMLARFRDEYPATRLLVISGNGDPVICDKVRRLAVDGFVLKHADPAVFVLASAAVLRGDAWFDNTSVVAPATDEARSLPLSPAELGLIPRQREVLALMLKGLSNKRVAQQLSLTEQTANEHVIGIIERLGARNRVELITRLRGKWIDA